MEKLSLACVQLKRRKQLHVLMTDLPFPSAPQDPFDRKGLHNYIILISLAACVHLVVIKTGLLLAHTGGVCLVFLCPEYSNNMLFHVAMHK